MRCLPCRPAPRPAGACPVRGGERGTVTAEFALVLTALMVLAVFLAAIGGAVLTHTRVGDAARTAARLAALETPPGQISAAVAAVAGSDAHLTWSRQGGWVSVTVQAPVPGPLGWVLPAARATAHLPSEPQETP